MLRNEIVVGSISARHSVTTTTVSTASNKILVAVKAEKVISNTALTWALTHVVHSNDSITLLAVYSAEKTGRRFWNFSRLAGDCSNGRAGKLPEKISDISESCAQMVLQLHNQVEVTYASAYHSLCEGRTALRTRNWQLVWQLEVPERIRVFIWQLGHNRLLTQNTIAKWDRGDGVCLICGGATETIIHALRDCPRMIQVWQQLVPSNHRVQFHLADYDNWYDWNISESGRTNDGFQWNRIWATTCYFAWRWRNQLIHDREFKWPRFPQNCIMQQVADYTNYAGNTISGLSSKTWVDIRWSPPEMGSIMLNTDGAFKSDSRIGGCGGCLRSNSGEWLSGFARQVVVSSAFMAELWGVWEGLKLAKDNGVQKIVLCVDSISVVQCIKRGREQGAVAGTVLRQIWKCLEELDGRIEVQHVFREANKCADHLANLGCQLSTDLVLFEQPPASVRPWLDHDILGVATPRLIPM